jgi:hypothetical protein
MSDDKVRENRLRRMAERQGLRLEKSRRRDPLALDYGLMRLVDSESGAAVTESTSLDAIEAVLREGRKRG